MAQVVVQDGGLVWCCLQDPSRGAFRDGVDSHQDQMLTVQQNHLINQRALLKDSLRGFLVVQRLTLCTPSTGGPGSIPGQ